MIKICEQYVIEYSIVFNLVKSKLMCFNSVSPDKPYITLCGKFVDVVDNYLHLGNRIYNNIYLEDSSCTLQYILSINVAECSVILVGLWIKDD